MLEPGLIVYKVYNGYWFFGRPTVEELRHDMRAVTMKCRPDWDITTPELRAAWQAGRKELFYPYGKTSARDARRAGMTTRQRKPITASPPPSRRSATTAGA